MENIEINEPTQAPEAFENIALNEQAQYYLFTAAKWAKFLGIMGFIFCGLFIIVSLAMGAILSGMTQMDPYNNPGTHMVAGMRGFIIAFYVLIDIFYFFSSLYIFQFGSKISSAIVLRDNIGITNALEKLKSLFKLWGISTIVFIGVYILIIIGAVIFATMRN
ncbi:DUF5362 family protein [Pedobacter insulae]|uniref:Uncharacterized protein n=1 Tax=Pedobacter insulae TaxID=414048 RepID=A0A1I2TE00_9SPHI|nr:DUF5362 family protein [Pedobacter insulae]SFG63050.1 hypothetical protein SAMN04489864_101351 [Pedobacter insulae]